MLITDPEQVREEFERFRERKVCMFAPCHESPNDIIAYGMVAQAVKEKHSIDKFTFTIGFTSSYPDHGQLLRIGNDDVLQGFHQVYSWLNGFFGEDGMFSDIDVIPFLDHGMPSIVKEALMQNKADTARYADTLDDSILYNEDVLKMVGTVMFDCSLLPLEVNIRKTAEYVDRFGKIVTVEGAPEHIAAASTVAGTTRTENVEDRLTKPDDVVRYMKKTGVDLVVPYIGTEHRETVRTGGKHYYGDRVQAITEAVGEAYNRPDRRMPVITLHGSSSCDPETEIPLVADDGVLKFNLYTAAGTAGGLAVAMYVLMNIDGIGGDAYEYLKTQLEGCDPDSISIPKPQLTFVAPASRELIHKQAVMKAIGYDSKTFETTQQTFFEKLQYQRLAD